MSEVALRENNLIATWPMLLDYSRCECLQILRRLELEAYGKVVAVLRAQGPLTEEKRKLLNKLQRFLSISVDRHRAEVRKALNDEELATISESICGKEVDEEWVLEGKRISPLFHRPSPETIFLSQANKTSYDQFIENYKLPCPSQTAISLNSIRSTICSTIKDIDNSQADSLVHSVSKSEIKTEDNNDKRIEDEVKSVNYLESETKFAGDDETKLYESRSATRETFENVSANVLTPMQQIVMTPTKSSDENVYSLNKNVVLSGQDELKKKTNLSYLETPGKLESSLISKSKIIYNYDDHKFNKSLNLVSPNVSQSHQTSLQSSAYLSTGSGRQSVNQSLFFYDANVSSDSRSLVTDSTTFSGSLENGLAQQRLGRISSGGKYKNRFSTHSVTTPNSSINKNWNTSHHGSQQLVVQMHRSVEDSSGTSSTNIQRFSILNASNQNCTADRPSATITRITNCPSGYQVQTNVSTSKVNPQARMPLRLNQERFVNVSRQESVSLVSNIQSSNCPTVSTTHPSSIIISNTKMTNNANSNFVKSTANMPVSSLPNLSVPHIIKSSNLSTPTLSSASSSSSLVVGSVMKSTVSSGNNVVLVDSLTRTNASSTTSLASTTTNNVIVFHKGLGVTCKMLNNSPSIRIGSSNLHTNQMQQQTVACSSSSSSYPSGSSRQIRIVGLSNPTIRPSNGPVSVGPQIVNSATTLNELVPSANDPISFPTHSSSTVNPVADSAAQSSKSRLNSILEVDLDADPYGNEQSRKSSFDIQPIQSCNNGDLPNAFNANNDQAPSIGDCGTSKCELVASSLKSSFLYNHLESRKKPRSKFDSVGLVRVSGSDDGLAISPEPKRHRMELDMINRE